MVDENEDVVDESENDDEGMLDADGALVHAANTLLLATEKAEMLNDTPALMKIAGGWMEIHEYLSGGPAQEERPKQPLGFAPAKQTTEQEEELDDAIAEPEGRSTKSYRGSGVYPQYGKLRKSQGRYFRRR